MKITIDINKIFRKVKSQKRGWVIIDQSDRDWHFGKSLETKDLQEIVQKIKNTLDKPVNVWYNVYNNWEITNKGLHNEN